MTTELLQNVFSKNRTEELGQDVWKYFVIPPFYSRLDFQGARKPHLIIGGRGCGKTMLLRYLSHQTVFSPERTSIPDSAVYHIGLYWRADTHFLSLMENRDIPNDVWHSAFNHMTALALGMEMMGSLRSIAESQSKLFNADRLESLDFQRLSAFDHTLPKGFRDLYKALEIKLWEFQSWVNNARKSIDPHFLAGEKFLIAMLVEIKSQLPEMKDANFFVYIDEYENLRIYQKKIINTWLKHSQVPLIFNLAMKRNAMDTKETMGPELLSDIHDFRTNDLEDELGDDFSIFAAEILFSKISLADKRVPVDLQLLRDPGRLLERRDSAYINRVNTAANTLFPGLSQLEMAKMVFKDQALTSKLKSRIKKALLKRNSDLSVDLFFRSNQPEASIVTPALIYRTSLRPNDILSNLENLENGKANEFTGSRGWIHNNFVGTYLQLYEPYSRVCPFYAGFQTFCQLAHGNLRYFIELCYKSLVQLEELDIDSPISIGIQAEAARQASSAFLQEIRSYGSHGLQLHAFVLRLGSLLAVAHQRPTQSEPEQTHFSIGGAGINQLSLEEKLILSEAIKWSVLYEETETKKKSSSDPEGIEYILAPIYAPYFHISYRKKRKLTLSDAECVTLIRGTYDEVKSLLNKYRSKWGVDSSDLNPTLFSHLEQN